MNGSWTENVVLWGFVLGFIQPLYKYKLKTFAYLSFTTVVGDYVNTMKTTFGFNFDLYQALKQHGYKKREADN